MNEPTKPSRQSRWFQFRLRTLLLLTLVIAAYFGGFSTARKLDEKVLQDAQDKAAAEMANAQQAALLAEQRAAAATTTFQTFPVVTYPGLRVYVPSAGPDIEVPYTYQPAYPLPVAPPPVAPPSQ